MLPKLAISGHCVTEFTLCYHVVSHIYSHHFLLGCQEIAEEFRSQEIDGQALLLLKEEHLMSAMNIKLGPALKICAKINVLKET